MTSYSFQQLSVPKDSNTHTPKKKKKPANIYIDSYTQIYIGVICLEFIHSLNEIQIMNSMRSLHLYKMRNQ
jgi:biopolymer transport protein ExbD